MSWFDNVKSPKLKISKKATTEAQVVSPGNLWKKCISCSEIIQESKLHEAHQVCPYCEHHFRLGVRERIELLIDKGTFEYFADNLTTIDPLNFTDKKSYKSRLEAEHLKTGLLDGTICGVGKMNGRDVALAVMNFNFMGGSMGVVTGEKIAYTFDKAYELKIPAIVVSASGGARMQEGILSLMQMAKTSAARGRLKNAGIPYISLITDPTTGGVAASFALLGDVNIAEPKALIGFAGPRVIEQTIRQVLPEGFQRAEFLRSHGFVDRIVHRHKLKEEIVFFADMFLPRQVGV